MDPAASRKIGILNIPIEILDHILEYFAPSMANNFTIDQRSSLSVESTVPEPPQNDQIEIWNAVCPEFKRSGLRLQYKRIDIRCSEEGFEKLRGISCQPDLAKYVKTLSYMVYGFSSLEREQFEALLEREVVKKKELDAEMLQRAQGSTRGNIPSLTNHQLRTKLSQSQSKQEAIRKMLVRSEEQRNIKDNKTDEEELCTALKAFSNLKEIRLMRVHDAIEVGWESYSRTVPELTSETKHARWAQACDHAAKTLARALLVSGCQPQCISGRALPPQTLVHLYDGLQSTDSGLAMGLSCLELQFDDRINLDEEILMLSGLLEEGFAAAAHVQGLHLDFTNPVSTPFESIFRDAHWANLRYIGFGAWKLSSADIIRFVLRHQTLTSIRLRRVLLKEGSKWSDVLKILRLKMHLRWVSLRGVGYANEEIRMPLFIDDDLYASDSDSDGSESDGERDASSDESHTAHLSESDEEGNSEGGSEVEDDRDRDSGNSEQDNVSHDEDTLTSESDLGGELEQTTSNLTADNQIMVDHPSTVSSLRTHCNCIGFAWESLENDMGLSPSKELWKSWQAWVINRCPEHDELASLAWQQRPEIIALFERSDSSTI